ncbi:hypothetical protein ONE63_002642 [Megalurothrips usitatus]|uniref:Disease resistance R13L4/SHOC-2-like LRR domain-containing protein n=1 Tax=Megalurothrips usitatus TaxID=439358 RepID=A0AAV7XB36_9NEOP|nr:hypothetical protein ONE63_002642 [Megalurothrips usitatus]
MEELIAEISLKRILHWNCRGFHFLPDELKEGYEVEEIYLKWNNLSSLPSWISKLQNLTNLYLPHNQLQSLPKELNELSKLTVLDVTNNSIEVLPFGLGHLSHLTQFLAARNTLSFIPNDFQNLKSLEILDISYNTFTRFPESILQCHSLQQLLLDNNKLTALPNNIVYLPYLKTLSVCGNNLLYLPLQPFLSNPFLSFENNPNLNYLSIWLGEQLSSNSSRNIDGNSWNLPRAQGCFCRIQIPNTYNGDIVVSDTNSKRERTLTLPPSLEYVLSGTGGEACVPTLLELALRKVYSLNCSHTIQRDGSGKKPTFMVKRTFPISLDHLSLPLQLKHHVGVGPVTLCYFCNGFIFTHGVVWVIPKDCYYESEEGPSAFCIFSTVIFCSVACSVSFAQWERKSTMPNKLETIKLQWHNAFKRRLCV